MSSLTGIAQFTNQFVKNITGYQDNKKEEAERVADKEYDRNRQQQQDQRAQETHNLNQKQGNLSLDIDNIKLDETKDARTDATDARNYGKTYNQVQYLKQLGDESGAIDAIVAGANSHSGLPYKINVDRDVNGKVAERTDENGNKYYFQNIIDKETGKVIRTDSVTYDQLMNGYKQLQNGQALAAEKEAYEVEKRKQKEKDASELSLYGAKKGIDVKADNIKAERDHIYKVDELGIKHGYTVDELGIKHGYTIDELGVRHANAVDLSNVNAQNNIGIRTAQSDLDAGGTPIVGGTAWGSFDALIGPESNGNQLDSKGRPLTSSAGAIGIAQVMPETAKYVANKHGIAWNANKYKTDPNYNYNLGKLYYQEQLNKYGHPALAYAAYNAGPGAVDKWIKKNPAMKNPDAMGMQNFINAIPFSETKNYVAKIHRQSGGVQVQRSVPGVPKLPKGSKKAESGKGIATSQDYNASIDKGVNTAIKSAKQLGIKPDVATTATFARAGTKLKEMGKAKNETEFLGLYQEAFDLVIDAVPERSRKKMSKADQNALGHKVLLSMVGASSLGNLKEIVYKINPSARSGGNSATANGLTLNLPGQQPQARAPARQTPQVGKLQGLYARGLPAPKTDPKTTENLNYLENLNDNMDW